ncbi:MAG: rod shape-determining protein MreC, partial [Anaerovoracaceae bacterium]
MKWFKEHKLFSITSGIVLGLCLIIIISYATSGGSTIIGKGVQTVAAVIEKPISYISGGIEKTFSGVFNYRKTQKENEALKEELIAVKEENLKLQMTQEELEELKKLSEVFSYEPFTTDRQAIAGEVIALDMSNPYVVFTIGVGSEKGIKKDNIVANEKGLVGKVYECG